MSKFQTKSAKRIEHRAPDDTLEIEDRPESVAPVAAEAPVKRGVGRPSEGVRGFATRLQPETIADIKALADGLRLRSEGKAIERAVSFYKAHLLREVRAKVGDLGEEAELLRSAHKVDD